MLERVGDILAQKDADAICFTSNGIVKDNGELVMGAGIALAFKNKYPFISKYFGSMVKKGGNKVYGQPISMYSPTLYICNFPTKHDWKDDSDLALIAASAAQLAALASIKGWKRIYLTRPGCGLGKLDWEKQVKPLISSVLDDKFVILTPPEKK